MSQQGRSGQPSSPKTIQNANPNIEEQRAATSSTITQPADLGSGSGRDVTTCVQCFPLNNREFHVQLSAFQVAMASDSTLTA